MEIQENINKNRVIGILFDVSGSMKEPFEKLTPKLQNKKEEINRVDSIINVIKTLCKKEKTTLFTLLFGCEGDEYKTQLFDFIFLLRKLEKIKNFNEEFNSDKINEYYKNEISNQYNYCSYGNELKRLLSKNGNRRLLIDKYIFTNYYGINEGKLKLMCDLLRGDDMLSDKIYNDLLDSSCKSNVSSVFKSSIGGNLLYFINHIYNGIPDKETKAAFETIDKIFELGFNKNKHKLPFLISMFIEERFNRKKDKKLTDISGSELINILTKIQKKIDDNNSKIMSVFEKEIYWNTPLYTAFNVALNKFREDFNDNQKFLLMITDGLANDIKNIYNYTDKIYKSAERNDIIVIGIYISDERKKPLSSKDNPKQLFDYLENSLNKGEKDLFKMSSKLSYNNPIISFLIGKGWKIPLSGECRLFFSVNDNNNLKEIVELINEATDFLERGEDLSISNLVASTVIQDYINSDVKNYAKDQRDRGTCWAHAISACIFFASSRIIGRVKTYPDEIDILDENGKKKFEFENMKHKLYKAFNLLSDEEFYKLKKEDREKIEEGQNTGSILPGVLKEYGLKSIEITENEARLAIIEGRPCVARFSLTKNQWRSFSAFFKDKRTKLSILRKSDLPSKGTDKLHGHAVVLTHIGPNYLKFLNSWGKDFGDNGFFSVTPGVLNETRYFDIFWKENDLSKEEKEAYKKYIENGRRRVKEYLEC